MCATGCTPPAPPSLEASRPVSGSEELLHKQEVKATCDSHWPAGSCQRAALSTLELDQREPPRAHTRIWIHREERKRRPVGTVSSLAEWANWEVKSLICSPALVAPSINSLACVCVCVCVCSQTFCISTAAVSVHQYQPGVCVGSKHGSSLCLTGRVEEEVVVGGKRQIWGIRPAAWTVSENITPGHWNTDCSTQFASSPEYSLIRDG